MLKNVFLFGLPTMLVCLALQANLLVVAVRYYLRNRRPTGQSSFWSSLLVIMGVMLLLLLGNMAQIGIWALLFVLLDEFEQFREAFYHSAVNFSTLGYGDIVMSSDHRVLGPLQALNGVLMIGVSTAALMSAMQDAMKGAVKPQQHRSD